MELGDAGAASHWHLPGASVDHNFLTPAGPWCPRPPRLCISSCVLTNQTHPSRSMVPPSPTPALAAFCVACCCRTNIINRHMRPGDSLRAAWRRREGKGHAFEYEAHGPVKGVQAQAQILS